MIKVERLLTNVPTTSWLNYKSDFPPTQGNTGALYSSGTWVPPVPGTYEIICIGGGGGGAGWYGSGGAGGNFATQQFQLVTTVYTITVGNGGAGAGQSTGGTGGTTIFNNGTTNLLTATGGTGGVFGGKGGDGGSGGGAVSDLSNSRPAWGGGGGGFSGSNGGNSPYKQVGTNGAAGLGSQSVPWGKGTNAFIPSGGDGTNSGGFIAGFGGSDYLDHFEYQGVYQYGKGRPGWWGNPRLATGRGCGGGGAAWAAPGDAGASGIFIWRLITPLSPITEIGSVTNIVATNQGSGRAFNNGQISLTWTAPNNTSGSPITSYSVASNPAGIGGTTATNSITLTGALSNTSYTFDIVAYTANGYGPTATSGSVTATTVPAAPTIGTASIISSTSVSVPFTVNSNGGSNITSFTATASPAGFTGTNTSSPVLVNGSYPFNISQTFTVFATNVNGNSVSSSASNALFPAGKTAAAPTIGTATVNSATSVSVSFTAPSDTGGLPITGYTATASPSGFTATGASSPLTLTGSYAANTQQGFVVYATNAAGNSPNSGKVFANPNGAPAQAWSSNVITSTGTLPAGNAGIMTNTFRRIYCWFVYTTEELEAAFGGRGSLTISRLRFEVPNAPANQPLPSYAIGIKSGNFSPTSNPGSTGYTVVSNPQNQSFTVNVTKEIIFDTPFVWNYTPLAFAFAWGLCPVGTSNTGLNLRGNGTLFWTASNSAGTFSINQSVGANTSTNIRPVIQLFG